MGIDGDDRHGNDAGNIRKVEDVWKYIKKDGDYITNMEFKTDAWGEAVALAKAGKSKDAMELLTQKKPRDVLLNGDRIESNLKRLCPKDNPILGAEICGFNKPWKGHDVIEDWFCKYVWPDEVSFSEDGTVQMDRKPCLFVIGDTCLGKTSFIRSRGNHLFFRNNFSLELWDEESPDYVVFDDCDWKFVVPANKKTILTGMGSCIATDKYMKKVHIKCTKPCVWISNELPDMTPEESKYWNDPRNGVWVCLGKDDYMYEK